VVTIREVAARAGVSPASVTRVIGGYPNVSPALRGRVIEAVTVLGYTPDLLATGLRRGTTQTIGVLINDILNPAIARMVDIIESELRTAGYGVIFANSNGTPANDLESLLLLRQRRVDALIASFADDTNEELGRAVAGLSIPTVLLDRKMVVDGIFAVLTDHHSAACVLTQHLIDMGHTKIALVNGSISGYPSRERLSAIEQTMKKNGLTLPDGFEIMGRGSEALGRNAVAQIFSTSAPPTAIVVGNGNTGALAGVLGEIRDRGIIIGRDLAVAAAEDSPLASLHTPPITALTRDIDGVALRATWLTLQLLGKKPLKAFEIVLPMSLVIRESTNWRLPSPA
jgi:LacI family transcriptional regulator